MADDGAVAAHSSGSAGEIAQDVVTLVASFEAGTIDPSSFHHRDHIRVAWSFLRLFPFAEGAMRFTEALRRFAASVGKPNLYHETITWAYLVLVHQRMQTGGTASWEEFAAANEELFAWKPSVLDRLYRAETLTSDLARRLFVLPDGP